MSKKLEQKQARRLAEERRRAEERKSAIRRNVISVGTAILVAAIVVTLIYVQREEGGPAGDLGVSPGQANCGEVETFEEQGADHIEVGAAHEPYNSSPPTSGPHYEIPGDTAFFTDPQPPEQFIHNMEHGQIVFWYAPDAPAETLENIEDLVRQEPLASAAIPYTDIESPYQFAMTAWGASQHCEEVSQEVVDDFRREYQGKGPEKIAPEFEG